MQIGITFDQCNVTSADDAHYHRTFLNAVDGVTKGCKVTADRQNIYVAKGYFVIYGRFVKVTGQETITPDAVQAGTLYCRLVYEVDLSKTNTLEEFQQGAFKILSSGSTYPTPTKQDLENGGTLYQMPFARFTVSSSGISNFISEANTINMANFYSTLAKTLSEYQTIADQMIEDLQNEGFVTQEAYHADNTPLNISIPVSAWIASGSNFYADVNCSKASSSAYCRLDISLRNPGTMTAANLKKAQKEYGYLYPQPTVWNGKIRFWARQKPTDAINLAVVGGIAQ